MTLSGMAKTAFLKEYQQSPWKKERVFFSSNWPLFDIYFAQQYFSYLDYELTRRLLQKYPHIKQEVAFFLCHLIMATREGHLCIRIEGHHLIPSVQYMWQSEENHFLSIEEANRLEEFIILGSQLVPKDLITELKADTYDEIFLTPLCRHQNHFYLQKYWMFETIFLKHFRACTKAFPKLLLDPIKVRESVQKLHQSGILLEEQAQAIENACEHSLSIITGGPGTGKTYTAGQLIRVFWESLSIEQRKKCKIVLAAPTGKAVINLQTHLGRLISELEGCAWTAKTLHALLEIKKSISTFKDTSSYLAADLVIIDESSMIDVQLMARLFKSIKEGTRVVLLGDQHQLPSVEAGHVFSDLIALANSQKEPYIPCTHLHKCLRAELRAIVDFADLINQGEADKALTILQHPASKGVERLLLPLDKKEAQFAFLNRVKEYFPAKIDKEIDSLQLIQLFQSIRILSPMRKGPFGVDALNLLFWSHFSSIHQGSGWLAIPIMITTNDYRRNLFNGETGTLMRRLPLSMDCADDYAVFPSREKDKEVRQIPAILLPKYEYAYCLSVHKSQGSEFDRIVLVMPEGSELFGREVFYTAVTRARKYIEVYGSDVILHKTITQKGKRLSGIGQRWNTSYLLV